MSQSDLSALSVAEMQHLTTYQDVAAVLRSPQARQALHRDSSLSGEIGEGPTDAFVGQSVISLHGQAHFSRRRLEARLFTRAERSRLELEIVLPALQDLLESTAGGQANLMVFSRLILIRASAAVVGIAPVEDIATADRLRVLAEDIVNAVAIDWVTENQEAVRRAGIEARDAFKTSFYDPARAGLTPASAADVGGLISLLLRNASTVGSEDVMFREAVLFLIASSTTTTNALPHAVWELELWLAKHPEQRSRLSRLAFCRSVASEALRLHPPVPALLRQVTEDTVLPSGLSLRAGEFVALDLISSSRDPRIFGDDSSEFNPLRAIPEAALPFGFSFGGGAHMCLGRTLAVGNPGDDEDAQAPQGILTRLVYELYKAGMTLDDQSRPTFREATQKNEYVSFPVRFSGTDS